jgi:hypothetical protein
MCTLRFVIGFEKYQYLEKFPSQALHGDPSELQFSHANMASESEDLFPSYKRISGFYLETIAYLIETIYST